ncbi:MAG: hypothetical protein AAB253_01700, partial [candidate division NC10 bacterium]
RRLPRGFRESRRSGVEGCGASARPAHRDPAESPGSPEAKVVLEPTSPFTTVYYVERIPALRIPATEVESVVAEKNRSDPFMDALTEEVLRSRGKGERLLKDHPDDNTLTFTLTAKAGEIFREFANRHPNELFEVAFTGQRLVLLR